MQQPPQEEANAILTPVYLLPYAPIALGSRLSRDFLGIVRQPPHPRLSTSETPHPRHTITFYRFNPWSLLKVSRMHIILVTAACGTKIHVLSEGRYSLW